jgi:hypothetical protein
LTTKSRLIKDDGTPGKELIWLWLCKSLQEELKLSTKRREVRDEREPIESGMLLM